MAKMEAHTGAETLEEDATPKVKQVYGDIQSAFRAPFVDGLFRALAVHPDFLELAWRQLQPNVRTIYFERRADEIRAVAATTVAHLGAPPKPDPDAADVLRVFQYVVPKLLLATSALRTASAGSVPALRLLPAEEKQQIVAGVPGNMPKPSISARDAAEAARATFEEVHATFGFVGTVYAALASWPDYLSWAWQSTRSISRLPEYRQVQVTLRRMADDAVLAFPFRMDCSPHTLRLCGMSESDIDEVRDTLERFYRALPGMVADVAFLSVGSEGEYAAQRSPFPAAIQ